MMQSLAAFIAGLPAGETIYLPAGEYSLNSTLDIRGMQIVGAHQDLVTIRYNGPSDTYAMSQMGTSDGGKGYLAGFTLVSSGHGIRTFGDGHRLERLTVQAAGDGITVELPIMTRLSQVYAKQCGGYGFRFIPHSAATMIGTSLAVDTCWAYACGKSGFRVETLAYSSFRNCASQDCGYAGTGYDRFGWAIIGNVSGEGVHPGCEFLQCATEADAQGMVIVNARNVLVSGLKHVANQDGPTGPLVMLGNVSGMFMGFRPQTPNFQMTHHLGFLPDPNNASWIWDSTGRDGAIVLLNSQVRVKRYPGLADNETAKRFTVVPGSAITVVP
jgi:hypothetical protein